MKKILILLLLLLNLHVITDKGGLCMEFGTVSAQSMMEEQLREVVVTGSLYADCDMCRGSFLRADLAYHKQYYCPARTVVCDICHVSYKAYEGHFCNGNGYSGSGPSSGPSSGNSSTSGNSGNTSSGNSSSGKTGKKPLAPPNDPSRNISISDLKKKEGVTLVRDDKHMPDKLHPQTKKWECVARSYAFMIELGGYNYDTALNCIYDIANEKKRNLNKNGIYPDELTTFFEEYCNVKKETFEPSVVESYINKGVPVGVVAGTTPPHMVTIIGYDKDFYYTAAGNDKGNATKYPKGDFYLHGYSYSIFTINYINNQDK